VFNDYEPDNLLLQQAFEEVLYNQLEAERIKRVFKRFNKQSIILKEITQPSPFSFPIMVDRLRDRLSNEGIEERLRKMLGQSEST
jgi:ATP-dependent Lhr-like helicase